MTTVEEFNKLQKELGLSEYAHVCNFERGVRIILDYHKENHIVRIHMSRRVDRRGGYTPFECFRDIYVEPTVDSIQQSIESINKAIYNKHIVNFLQMLPKRVKRKGKKLTPLQQQTVSQLLDTVDDLLLHVAHIYSQKQRVGLTKKAMAHVKSALAELEKIST